MNLKTRVIHGTVAVTVRINIVKIITVLFPPSPPPYQSQSQKMNSNSGEPEIETPSKRLRLNDDVNSEQPCASSSSRQTSVQQLKKQRDACRFGSDCYRRNETHLLHYRHTLCEDEE